jgi:hypothetical protein
MREDVNTNAARIGAMQKQIDQLTKINKKLQKDLTALKKK